MKKLTKKQRDWLIEEIKNKTPALALTEHQAIGLGCYAYAMDDMERTINQCTEDEDDT